MVPSRDVSDETLRAPWPVRQHDATAGLRRDVEELRARVAAIEQTLAAMAAGSRLAETTPTYANDEPTLDGGRLLTLRECLAALNGAGPVRREREQGGESERRHGHNH